MPNEVWITIDGFSSYEVSNTGMVRRITPAKGAKVGRILKAHGNPLYLQVNLFAKNQSFRRHIHRLVAQAFLGPCPEGYEVNHKDGNRRNNHASNLEYCTHRENLQHAARNGLMASGERNGMAKLTAAAVGEIRTAIAAGESDRSIADRMGLSYGYVNDIRHRRRRALA